MSGRPESIDDLLERLTTAQTARLLERLDELEALGASTERKSDAASRADVVAAYVVRRSGESLSESDIRSGLEKVLPDYMVPARFVFVDELPTTSTGKVDRKRLPRLPAGSARTERSASAEPDSDAAKTLLGIWADVLGFEDVGLHDDFFEMGGDSLLSIRILARARQAGIVVSPQAFFDAPTVDGMVAASRDAAPAPTSTDRSSGPVPLTPIQHWFFERDFPERHHWNQAVALELPPQYSSSTIRSALESLVTHHDALRLGFHRREPESGWRAEIVPPGTRPELAVHEMQGLSPQEERAALDRIATELHRSFDLAAGSLLRAALFEGDTVRRLLLVVHHLAVDGLSWSVLVEHLEQACRQLAASESVELPKTASFYDWAHALDRHARSQALDAERDFWLAQEGSPAHRLPIDAADGRDENYVRDQESVEVHLNEAETKALLHEAPRAYHLQVNELILAALAKTLAGWSGRSSVLIDLEGHGREDIGADLDVSATVGWFTTVFPAQFDLPPEMTDAAILTAVKEQLRGIPRAGLGYGLLRYHHPDESVRRQTREIPISDLVFNYLGPTWVERSQGFPIADVPCGEARSSKGRRPYLHEINASIDSGVFTATWSYSQRAHRPETIREQADAFVANLRALIQHCLGEETFGHTPSDFPLAGVDQSELDRIAALLDRDE